MRLCNVVVVPQSGRAHHLSIAERAQPPVRGGIDGRRLGVAEQCDGVPLDHSAQAGRARTRTATLHLPYQTRKSRTSELFVRAFDGSPLAGRWLVRIVYLDESGTSREEPLAVVAGVVLHGDSQLIAVEEHLERLVEKHIPEDDRQDFFFHATNIWSGTRYFSNRDRWPLDQRLEILHDLVEIPQQFDVPVVFGYCPRDELITAPSDYNPEERERDAVVHSIAFVECACVVEKLMRELWSDEVALLIAEDRPCVRDTVRDVHSLMRSKKGTEQLDAEQYLPLSHIRDTVHWAGKMQSRHLQLADICAFVIRGHLDKHPQNPPLYSKLRPMMAVYPKSDDE